MKLLVINGPNLNLLGVREPGIYGTLDYNGMIELVRTECAEAGIETDFYQSNHEGDLVDVILDALKAVALPAAEVHISDVTKREPFRQISYAGMACCVHVIGQGVAGYGMAARQLAEKIQKGQVC